MRNILANYGFSKNATFRYVEGWLEILPQNQLNNLYQDLLKLK